MIRCLVFDVDGTLMPSNHIKRQAYSEIVSGNPAAATRVDVIASNVALDRYEVFAQLCAEFPNIGDSRRLAERYGELCHARVLPLFRDGPTRALMENLSRSGIQPHIATAAPLTAITALLVAAEMIDLFVSVHGRPQTKAEAVAQICTTSDFHPSQVAVIGDGDNDRDAAAANRCHFVRVAGDAHELHAASPSAGLAFLTDALQMPRICETVP